MKWETGSFITRGENNNTSCEEDQASCVKDLQEGVKKLILDVDFAVMLTKNFHIRFDYSYLSVRKPSFVTQLF